VTSIDDALRMGRRGLRTRPGSLMLGSTGARLWADYLDDAPGFAGAIDFIHKLNIPLLFSITHDAKAPPSPSSVVWQPSHSHTRQSFGGLELDERKFITWHDCAVSLQRWHNGGSAPVTLSLTTDSDWLNQVDHGARGEKTIEAHGFTLRALIVTTLPALWSGVTIAPGETLEFAVTAAMGETGSDSWPVLEQGAAASLAGDQDSILATQIQSYQAWFDRAPQFSSSSPMLDKAYAYRWFIMRQTLARPGIGPFKGVFFYEGRSHKMTKTPWAPVGWEFSKLIPLSTPMHLLESRWHQDEELGVDILGVLAQAQGEDGQFHSRTLTKQMHPYANFMGWGCYQYALARGLSPAMADALPMLKRQVLGEAQFLATGGDSLPIQQRHQLTGKEYQPSYWYFHDYPDDPLDPATYTPLKRVDRAIYNYLNARGIAALCRMAGDDDAERFDRLAETIAGDVLGKQWDAESAFFYDLHHQTDAKAMVRNVVGFYPYWAGITGAEHLDGMLKALGPEEFGTANPLPSVSPDCPVFQPSGSWKGRFLKGRNGCMWDGPTWPYTNSIAIDAIGQVSRDNDHRQDGLFADYFWKFVLLHFHQQDGQTPYLVEHYDGLTGEPLSDEPDYSHSYFIDLLIRQVVGLDISQPGTIRIDPIDIGLDQFELSNVMVGPRRLTVRFAPDTGLSLLVDGTEVAGRPDRGTLEYRTPGA